MININRVIFLLLSLLTLFFLMYKLFEPFLLSLFVALLLAISTNAIRVKIANKLQNKTIVTLTMTTLLFALFFSPLLYFVIKIVDILKDINQDIIINFYNQFIAVIKDISNLKDTTSSSVINFFDAIDIKSLLEGSLKTGSKIGLNTAGFIINLVFIIIFYTIFVFYSQDLISYLKSFVPIAKIEKDELFGGLSDTMGVVFYSILSTAIIEGILFGFFISSFGYDGVLFGVLYGFASLIPIIGGAIMWVPFVIVEVAAGNYMSALYIAMYSIIVISIFADTILKPLIIKYINHNIVKKPTKINELVVFFSIVAGLGAFGFWGMIIGPALVTIFLLILDIIINKNKEVS
ncbi:MAG: AI-2E family transporter [Epsilonproteobacteria bacterium]|nr:MAG: AI-2E family transporter [Campylobacterota bacterium]